LFCFIINDLPFTQTTPPRTGKINIEQAVQHNTRCHLAVRQITRQKIIQLHKQIKVFASYSEAHKTTTFQSTNSAHIWYQMSYAINA